jgi:hypothetical protein
MRHVERFRQGGYLCRQWTESGDQAGPRNISVTLIRFSDVARRCLFNDPQYVAHDKGIRLESVQVKVTITFEGSPLLATRATMCAKVNAFDKGADVAGLVRRAEEISTVGNSVQRGISVETTVDS